MANTDRSEFVQPGVLRRRGLEKRRQAGAESGPATIGETVSCVRRVRQHVELIGV